MRPQPTRRRRNVLPNGLLNMPGSPVAGQMTSLGMPLTPRASSGYAFPMPAFHMSGATRGNPGTGLIFRRPVGTAPGPALERDNFVFNDLVPRRVATRRHRRCRERWKEDTGESGS